MKTPPASAHPTPTDHFTNFTEISYGKTRDSYDFSEVPRTTPRPPCSPVRFAPNGRKWAQMTRISSFSAPESEALSQL